MSNTLSNVLSIVGSLLMLLSLPILHAGVIGTAAFMAVTGALLVVASTFTGETK